MNPHQQIDLASERKHGKNEASILHMPSFRADRYLNHGVLLSAVVYVINEISISLKSNEDLMLSLMHIHYILSIGISCNICDNNYYGNPEVPGGECQLCNCNGNTNPRAPGNCDSRTGQCLQCLYDTAGDNCEVCAPNYYGDALLRTCTRKRLFDLNLSKNYLLYVVISVEIK